MNCILMLIRSGKIYVARCKAMKKYIVTEDADMLAPDWLAVRINYRNVKIVYHLVDGAEKLKGVMIYGELAEIGDTVAFDGKKLSVERR